MELSLIKDLLIILGFSILVLLLGYRLRIPPVVGFILTGVLAGPHGLGLVGESGDVDTLAQMGIVLLLFGIGMEFSRKRLVQIKRLFLLGGTLQVGLTIALSFFVALAIGRPWGEAVFLGFLLSMSSTAVVLGILDQKGETASPHGRLSISILIFQDMVAIPMILLTPLLGQAHDGSGANVSLLWPLAKGLAILAFVFICAQRFVPRVLFLVARTRNKELFLLSVLTLCFGVAWLTSSLGLSLTIGAFLAGLVISESEFSNEAVSNIFPFQALFISFFFVSVGMLLNLDFVFSHPWMLLGLAAAIMGAKILTAGLTTFLLGLPIRTAVLVGISLCQIGEFSFVLAKTGIPYGLGSDYYYQIFLASSLLTLLISPILINLSPRIACWISAVLPIPEKLRTGLRNQMADEKHVLNQHVIIVGFGISGRNLARSCKLATIPYAILEMNPETVKEQKGKGEPIHFGDATHLSVLEHLRLHDAKALAVLVNDPIAARRIVKIARQANPSLYIIVRARYVHEMPLMTKLGADEAIPDEFGTSVEVFSRVLRQYHVPDEEINGLIADLRADGYEMLRNHHLDSTKLSDIKLDLSTIEIGSFRLHHNSPLVGKVLSDSQLRSNHSLSVLLIRRQEGVVANPPPTTKFLENDIVVVVGEKMHLKKSSELFGHEVKV